MYTVFPPPLISNPLWLKATIVYYPLYSDHTKLCSRIWARVYNNTGNTCRSWAYYPLWNPIIPRIARHSPYHGCHFLSLHPPNNALIGILYPTQSSLFRSLGSAWIRWWWIISSLSLRLRTVWSQHTTTIISRLDFLRQGLTNYSGRCTYLSSIPQPPLTPYILKKI